jgi:hypothetical protein
MPMFENRYLAYNINITITFIMHLVTTMKLQMILETKLNSIHPGIEIDVRIYRIYTHNVSWK